LPIRLPCLTALAATLLLVFVAILAPSPSQAASPTTVRLADLTWTELKAAIAAGDTTIIIPVGGTEQSGPAIALGKHNVRVAALSEKIATALGNALVAPVIAYVPEGDVNDPSGHLAFPGTITIPDQAFETVVEYAARSFKLHGFKDIVLIGDHGGYQADLKTVADRLDKEWAKTSVRVHFIPQYYDVTQQDYVSLLEMRGFSAAEIGTHAGLDDTSLMLAVDPSLVRAERLAAAPKLGPADGVFGDPARSSAALGQLGVELVVDKTVAAIRAAVKR
jgi:creatinine amidohydrolase/Fe(II)-dependent formamide hydrolase-like protein